MVERADLQAVVEQEMLALAVAIDAAGRTIAEYGEVAACPAPELVSALLGPHGEPKDTYDHLEGQLLPRIWSQGGYLAFVDRPAPGVAVVLFDKARPPDTGDPLQKARWQFQRSRQVASVLRARIGAPPLDRGAIGPE